MKIKNHYFINLIALVLGALFLRIYIEKFLDDGNPVWLKITGVMVIIIVGAFFVLKGTAEIIEETTGVLSSRTKIASGLLQSIGTAFPDMVLGIVSAVISLGLVKENYALAISFAIIAASTTFGSNIYNIAHAAWCVYRQNLSNKKGASVAMLPGVKSMGRVVPMKDHTRKPSLKEMDVSLDVLNALSLLTMFVAVSMVIFGRVNNPPSNISGDVYQMIMPIGWLVLLLCVAVMYFFRNNKREDTLNEAEHKEELYFEKKSTLIIIFYLVVSGIAILFAAESMVKAVQVFCSVTGTPFVIAGVLAGAIGCIGEMIVVHNFTVNPKGRIGDALVGVAMDNIVTTMGAAVVAIIGGIFLGGNSLILIFVIILTLNSVLIGQISKLKNYFLKQN